MISIKNKSKGLVEKITNLLLNILIFIFGIILLVSIYTGVQTKILGNKYTNFFGYSIFEVQTGSMEDTINAGDWIIVKLTKKVKINDIITYELENNFITHRVIEIYKGTYITKGDANNTKDLPIDQKQVVGKVVSVLGNLGILRKTIFNLPVLIALIVTLFIFNLEFKKKDVEKYKKILSNIKNLNIKNLNINDMLKSVLAKIKRINIVRKLKLFILNIKIKYAKKDVHVEKKLKNNITLSTFDGLPNEVSTKEIDTSNTIDTNNNQILLNDGEEIYRDEDELDKTSFFRVVSVDLNDAGEQYKIKDENVDEEVYRDEDDLDKTSLFRTISVDSTEINDTLFEIAKNELKEPKQKEEIIEEAVVEKENEFVEDDSLAKVNLDLLKSRMSKKSKNIIDTAMNIKRDKIDELINLIAEDYKNYMNNVVKDEFLNAYIDARYYNYSSEDKYRVKNVYSVVNKIFDDLSNSLIKNYKGSNKKYNNTVSLYNNLFKLIVSLEKANSSIDDIKAKNEFYKKEILKYFSDLNVEKVEYIVEGIKKIQRNYNSMLKCFLEELQTNSFMLNFNQLSTKKNIYSLNLEHNILFSRMYSDYIIDKTYSEGIIAEDKMSVLLTLLSARLVEDMIYSETKNTYILYIPNTLYEKEKKLEKTLKMIDDRYAKEKVLILLSYEELIKNKTVIKELRKNSYRFALVFDKEVEIKSKDIGNIYMTDYIFINKKAIDTSKVLPYIPEELLNNIIYEDIIGKVGDFGGE